MVMSKILGPDGQPLQLSDLDEPQSAKLTSLHHTFAGHPARGLTPSRLNSILQDAEQGNLVAQAELFEDMEERSGHIACEMGKRRRALLSIDWTIAPPTNPSAREKKAAKQLRELVNELDDFEQALLDVTDAIGKGFAALEYEWHQLDGLWLPDAIHHRDQSWFQITRAFGNEEIRLRDNSQDGEVLRPFGWMVHTHKAKSGYLARAGLYRVLVWPYLFANYAVGDMAEFLEIVGIPLRIGKYPNAAPEKDKLTLLRALASIGHNAAGIIPEGMMLEFHDAAVGNSDPFMAMINWAEKSISKAVLGGTLTSQADGKTSTNALGQVHDEVRRDLRDADARQVARTITRDLIYPIAMLNGLTDGLRRCPRFEFDLKDPKDIGVFASNLPGLVSMGFKINRDWAQREVGIPEPEDDSDLLHAPNAASPVAMPVLPVPDGSGKAALSAEIDADGNGDVVELASDALMVSTAGVIKGWVKSMQAHAGQFDSFGAYTDHLIDGGAGLPLDALAEELAKALATIGLAGRASVADELEAEIGAPAVAALAGIIQSDAGVIDRGWAPAADFFRQKVNLPTLTWRDLWQGQHARAFVVAGATRDALLRDLRESVRAAIEDGIDFTTFQRQFEELVARNKWTGWTGSDTDAGRLWRARVIYNTNLSTARAAGRYRQMTDPATLQHMPFWQYQHHTITHPRETHIAWDGLVLRWDDPWWKTHFPPNGWGCNCNVRPVSQRMLDRMGKTGPDQAPPAGAGDPPPEWAYNVGETAWGKPVADAIINSERGGSFRSLDTRGPGDFNRPSSVPFDPIDIALGEPIRDPELLSQAFRRAIGGDSVILTDPTDARVNVTSALIDHWVEDVSRLQGREQFLPLLTTLVEEPFEIWAGFALNELTGKVELRRRYIRGFAVGKNRIVGLVADAVGNQWVSLTMFAGGSTASKNLRQGYLVWGRP